MGPGALSGAAEGSQRQRDLVFWHLDHDATTRPKSKTRLVPVRRGNGKTLHATKKKKKNGIIVCPRRDTYHLSILLTTPSHSHGHVSETCLRWGL